MISVGGQPSVLRVWSASCVLSVGRLIWKAAPPHNYPQTGQSHRTFITKQGARRCSGLPCRTAVCFTGLPCEFLRSRGSPRCARSGLGYLLVRGALSTAAQGGAGVLVRPSRD